METNNINQNIPEMQTDKKYSDNKISVEDSTKIKKEMEKTKKELEKLKSFIIKKYPYVKSVSILPPQIIKRFVEEEEIPKETEKYVQLYVIIPEEKLKEIPKIKESIIKELEKLKQKIWLQIKTPVDIWEICLDSKFDLTSAIAMSFPLYDEGFLGALRLVEIHKSLVLQKFEKYVVSYIFTGSFIRGDATPTSDIDVSVIINDTDVKRMPRIELKERLRSIIYQYVAEATALAGVKNTLHIQTYLLTDFWDSVKDANPVIFTFIRDGIPIHDRQTFMPWKALLKMGKLKPSPESIDMFMKTAEKTKEMADRRMVDAMIDIYYSVLNPSQALIMLYGLPPPTHKETPKLMNEIFVEKEKMLKKGEIAILEKCVKLFKEYEHDTKYKIKGVEIDKIYKDSEVYLKRLKELRKQIEKRAQEKTIDQIHGDVFELLKGILGKMSQEKLILEFEKRFVKIGKFSKHHLRILKNIITTKREFKKGKLDSQRIDETRKNAAILINDLIEYSQRCDLASLEKRKMTLKYGDNKIAEILHCNGVSFLFKENEIKKITDKIEKSDMNEVSENVDSQKIEELKINPKVFDLVHKELGKYELIL